MKTATEFYPSTQQLPTRNIDAPPYEINLIDVAPLSDQRQSTELKKIPDKLRDPLFGHPTATAAESRAFEGDPNDLPRLQTYAVLDAAKVQGLPEMLETSGLEHRCLFTGEAFDELKDAAPWIVKLEQDAPLLEYLFTQSDAPWHLWDAEPGVFLRSTKPLKEVWSYLRKFTRIKDEAGNWFYQRFWEPATLTHALNLDSSPFVANEDAGIRFVIGISSNQAQIVELKLAERNRQTPILTLQDRKSFDKAVEDRYIRDFAAQMSHAAPDQLHLLGTQDPKIIEGVVAGVLDNLRAVGFRRRSDIGRIVVLALFYGRWMFWDPRIEDRAKSILALAQRSPAIRALRFEESLKQSPRHAALTTMTSLSQVANILRTLKLGDVEPLPKAVEWDLADPAIHAKFLSVCHEQQDRHTLPPRQETDHRIVHEYLACLWTPFFLDDPVHQGLRELFEQSELSVAAQVADELDGRLERCKGEVTHG